MTVRMLSRFVSPAEQKRIVADVAAGKVDVVIGTHRLLGRTCAFKDLGLLVVDEEQRFGVAHKERLKQFRAHVDVLTMTATPIPRTLEMALAGIREMSTVDTPPEDRQPVLTYVGPYDEGLALGAVRRELLREGQVFWVHNRVATIDRQAAWLQRAAPGGPDRGRATGRWTRTQLEQQMVRFWDREADVLVCTTIIESGLDVPNANTLVVDRADRLGLAQLYQLRGRVGRSAERAFAYFFFPPQRELTEEAHERLATIAQHRRSGRGFQHRHAGPRDPRRRQPARRRAARPHRRGRVRHVRAASSQESVAEMQGEDPPQETELRIDLPVKAFIPPGWVAQEALRLELYRRIAMARDHEALAMIRAETDDRFGALPEPVEALFAVGSLRLTAQAPRRRGDHHVPGSGPAHAGHVVGGRGARPVGRVQGATFAEPTQHAEPRAGARLRRGSRPVGGVTAATGGGGADRPGAAAAGRRNAARLVDFLHASPQAILLACPGGRRRARDPGDRVLGQHARPRRRGLRRRQRHHEWRSWPAPRRCSRASPRCSSPPAVRSTARPTRRRPPATASRSAR